VTIKKGITGLIILLAFVTVGIQMYLQSHPLHAESWYGGNIYPSVRPILDELHLPIPGLFLSIGLVLLILMTCFFIAFRKAKIWTALKYVAVLIAVLLTSFYWLWGFNYSRPDIVDRMGYNEMIPDTSWLFGESENVINRLNELRSMESLGYIGSLSREEIIKKNLDVTELNSELEKILPSFKYNQKVKTNLHFIRPDGTLLHWSTAGIYWPFTGESNVDSGVHYLKKPVTITHELAHAHGLTSEGDCNFVAYLACVQSDQPLYEYSAHLSYIGYLLRDILNNCGQNRLNEFYDKMDQAVIDDRRSIYEQHDQYSDYMPELRNKIYDLFLKSQGVKGGIESYNYFVRLKYNMDLTRTE